MLQQNSFFRVIIAVMYAYSVLYRSLRFCANRHDSNRLREREGQKENVDRCSRRWHTRCGPTRWRCLKGVASRYISSHESGLAYSELARKRENPNWSLNLSFVTGLRQSTAAEKSLALEEIEWPNNFYHAILRVLSPSPDCHFRSACRQRLRTCCLIFLKCALNRWPSVHILIFFRP